MEENRSAVEQASGSSQLIVSYTLFLCVAALLVMGFATPMFRVSHIAVVGDKQSAGEIDALSGIVGTSIFTIRAASLERVIESRLPNLLVTCVHLSIPSTVSVCATMRQPVMGLQTKDGFFLVNKYGRVISGTTHTTLPVVRDTTKTPVTIGGYVNQWIPVRVRWTLHQLPKAAIDHFTLGSKRGMIVTSAHGWRAVLGWPTGLQLAKRVAELKALLHHGYSTGQPLLYADLTGLNPIASFAAAQPAPASGY